MNLKKKTVIRKAIRHAIKFQNRRVLFSCRDCNFCGDTCQLDPSNRMSTSLRQASQLPDCFHYNVFDSAFSGVLQTMIGMGIDFHEANHGWPTVVNRIASRANRFGYVTGVSQRNLEKYG